jgi:hypothetical protein
MERVRPDHPENRDHHRALAAGAEVSARQPNENGARTSDAPPNCGEGTHCCNGFTELGWSGRRDLNPVRPYRLVSARAKWSPFQRHSKTAVIAGVGVSCCGGTTMAQKDGLLRLPGDTLSSGCPVWVWLARVAHGWAGRPTRSSFKRGDFAHATHTRPIVLCHGPKKRKISSSPRSYHSSPSVGRRRSA